MLVQKSLKKQLKYVKTFALWIVFGCSMGILMGVIGFSFHFCTEEVGELREAHTWLFWLLPAGGAAIVSLYHLCGMKQDKGTNLILVAVRDNKRMKWATAPLIYVSTVITHLVGGSSGREGAALQLGGSLASAIGHRLRLNSSSLRILVVCGMSAGFSAVFGTPLASALFAMEVVHVGVIHYSGFVPAILSSLVAYEVSGFFGWKATSYFVSGIPALTPLSMLQVTALGVLFAILAIIFYNAIHTATHLYQKYIPNAFLRAAVGGVLVLFFTLLLRTHDYNGTGNAIIAAAIEGNARPEAFLLKILLTAITLGAGFKGGEIVPAFFTGATFGCAVGPLLGLNPSFAAALGMTAMFCGITNCPITSVLLSYELFGGRGMLFFTLCCAVSFMLSGHGGLYSEQQMLFSKLGPELRVKETEKQALEHKKPEKQALEHKKPKKQALENKEPEKQEEEDHVALKH